MLSKAKENGMSDVLMDYFYKIIDAFRRFSFREWIYTAGYLLTLLCGVFFLIHSFQMRTEKKEFFERALPVTATVSRIEIKYEKDSQDNIIGKREVYVDYEINGNSYEDIYLYRTENSIGEGDLVEVFYDPLNVTEVKIYQDADGSLILGVLFSVFAIGIPLIFLILQIRRNMY